MNAGQLDSAIHLFDESAHLEPHFKTLELLGECLLKQSRYRDAVIPLAASVGLGAQPYRALFLLARALDSLGMRTEAIEKLVQAIAMKPDFKSAIDFLNRLRQPADK